MAFTLNNVGDVHVHFRQDKRWKRKDLQNTQLLQFSVSHTAMWASFVLPMPNTEPSIRTGQQALDYANEIAQASAQKMHVIKCVKAVEGFTTPAIIREARRLGVDAIKVYFEGVTTNANHGDAVTWEGFFEMIDVWRACEDVDMVVCIHLEKPGVFSLRREQVAHEAIEWLVKMCPNLRICIEHVTDRRTLELVARLGRNVRCTITAHHPWGDLDMVIGGNLNSHAFCKPIPKLPEDRAALRAALHSGDPKFMFGSDTAPHPLEDKEHEGCAGCFTGPYCLQMVAHMLEEDGFAEEGIRMTMQGFVGDFARVFYRIPSMGRTVTLERKPFQIPDILHTSTGVPVVPFLAGQTLNWSIV